MIKQTTKQMYKRMIFKYDKEADDLVTKFLSKDIEVISNQYLNKHCVMRYKDLYLKVWVNTDSDNNYKTNFSSIYFIQDIRSKAILENKYLSLIQVIGSHTSNEYANVLYKKDNIKISLENINKIETLCKDTISKNYKPDYLNQILDQ